MQFKTIGSLLSILGLITFADSLLATNVRVIVEENVGGRPRISQANVCLLASDGSVKSQITDAQGTTVFNNVSIGSTTVRAHRNGFNQRTVTISLQSVPEETVTLSLNSGTAAPLPCNVQNARDVTGLFTIVPPNPIFPGAAATYRFTVSNIGQSNAPNVVARIDLPLGFGFPTFQTPVSTSLTCGAAGGGGAPFRITCSPATIDGGGSRIAIFSSIVPSNITNTQSFTVQAVVDPSNTVIEGNENNNTTSTITTVSIQAAPDLRLDLSGSDTQVFLYDEYDYLLKVRNAGVGGAGTVIAKVTLPPEANFVRLENNTFNNCPRDGQVINCQANGIIPNNERSVRIVAKPKQTTPGGRQMLMSVKVDPDNEIPESNETNNTAFVSTTTDISPTDLNMTEVHSSEIKIINIGGGFFVEADVRNSGSNRSLPSSVRLTLPSACEDHTSNCLPGENCNIGGQDCSQNPCPLGALDPGEEAIKIFTVKCDDGDPFKSSIAIVTLCADPGNLLPETNESNNCRNVNISF